MLALRLAIIAIAGALGFAKRIPNWLSTSVAGILTVYGVVTSPDITTRLLYLAALALGPLLPYALSLARSLTIQPLKYYLRWKADHHRTCFEVKPGDAHNDAAGEQLDVHVKALVAAGFVSRGRVGMPAGKHVVVHELLDRGNGLEWAIVTTTLPASVQPVVLQCSCQFADGETLIVSNYQFVDTSPPAPGFINFRLPSIDSATDVVRACQLLASRAGHGPVVADPLNTDLLTRVKERTRRRLDADVKTGHFRYDAARDVYGATLRGAYRSFWRSLGPWHAIVSRRDRQREKAILEELGIPPREKPPSEDSRPKVWLWAEAVALIVILVLLAGWGPELLAMIGPRDRPIMRPNVSVPAGFSVPDSFPGAIQALEQLVGQPSHQLSGTKDDEPFPTIGVAISMRSDSAAAFVAVAQDAFLARGFYLFRTGERFSGLDTNGLALWPSADPYEIMRAMDTNAANHGMLVEEVVAWFRREEARYPIRFTAIGFDYAGGRLLGDMPDVNGYASRFMRFCPDLQGEGLTTRSLAKDLKRTREVYCWWD